MIGWIVEGTVVKKHSRIGWIVAPQDRIVRAALRTIQWTVNGKRKLWIECTYPAGARNRLKQHSTYRHADQIFPSRRAAERALALEALA